MIGSDLLDSSSRAFGMSLGCFFNWTFNFFVGISFPSLENLLGENVYAIFAISCIILVIIVTFGLDGTPNQVDDIDSDVFTRKMSVNSTYDAEKVRKDHLPHYVSENNNSIHVISLRSRC
jgi:hypothetical protein